MSSKERRRKVILLLALENLSLLWLSTFKSGQYPTLPYHIYRELYTLYGHRHFIRCIDIVMQKPLERDYCGFAYVLISKDLSKRPFQHFSYVTFVLYYNLQVSPIFSSSRTCFDNRLRSASLSFIRVIISKSASDVFGALPNDIYRIREKPKYVSILFTAVQHWAPSCHIYLQELERFQRIEIVAWLLAYLQIAAWISMRGCLHSLKGWRNPTLLSEWTRMRSWRCYFAKHRLILQL